MRDDEDERELLRQIRRRLTVIAIGTTIIAAIVTVPLITDALHALTRRVDALGVFLWVGVLAISFFFVSLIAISLRSAPAEPRDRRRGFEPIVPDAPTNRSE